MTPDVSVTKRGDDYEVILNDDGLPPLRVNSLYAAMAADKAGTSLDTRKYLEERLRAAAWFVKSIEQRRQTILKVCRSIVRFQKDFLDDGVSCFKTPDFEGCGARYRDARIDRESCYDRQVYGYAAGCFELQVFFPQRVGIE